MNGIDRFEALAEQVVEGTFGKLFRPPLHPSDVMRRLARVVEDGAVERDGRLVLPNCICVWLSQADHEALCSLDGELAEQAFRVWLESLAHALSGTFFGELDVTLRVKSGMASGDVEISAVQSPGRCAPGDTREIAVVRPDDNRPAEWALCRDGDVLPLGQRLIRVGRAPDNDVVLDDPSVSRYHLELSWRGQGYVVTDRGSSYGTAVNGRRLDPGQDVDLRDGDEVGIGTLRTVVTRRNQGENGSL